MAESLAWKSDASSAPSAMASICIEHTGPIISLPKKVSVANFEYLFIYLAISMYLITNGCDF
uniref:E2F4,5 n=1 Tax=Solanum tuberosum TaxID=4113 RepID=M1A3L2_SOLTU